jgi:hypothetical protein
MLIRTSDAAGLSEQAFSYRDRAVALVGTGARPNRDGPAILYVRPEYVVVAEHANWADGHLLMGIVVAVHRSGSVRRMVLRLEDTDAVVEAVVPAGRDLPAIGTTAKCHFLKPGVFGF